MAFSVSSSMSYNRDANRRYVVTESRRSNSDGLLKIPNGAGAVSSFQGKVRQGIIGRAQSRIHEQRYSVHPPTRSASSLQEQHIPQKLVRLVVGMKRDDLSQHLFLDLQVP